MTSDARLDRCKPRRDILFMATTCRLLFERGVSGKPKATETAIIPHCAGVQVQEVYEHFVFADDADKDDPRKVGDKLAVARDQTMSLRHIGFRT